jgi:hypothetical protein
MLDRINTLAITDDELIDHLRIIASAFTEDWLVAKGGNPIQKLWQREDVTSTIELYTLANSIQKLATINQKWTKEQIKLAKSKDLNSVRGALFELLTLNILDAPGHPVVPAKMNQAGFDGVLTSAQGQELRVSIKNYGSSTYQHKFEHKAKEFEKTILALLKRYRYPPCQIILDFPSAYPGDREWNFLYESLNEWFNQHALDPMPFLAAAEPIDPTKPTRDENVRVLYSLTIAPFKGPHLAPFHLSYQSHTFLALASYHQNEYKNLYSKLEDACANLVKHSATETPDRANALFIHLPDTVTIQQGMAWVNQYFTDYPYKPISLVFLYQPSVAHDLANKNSFVAHGFQMYVKAGSPVATGFTTNYTFSVPIGLVSSESVKKTLVAERPNGLDPTIPLYDRYVYQNGLFHYRMQPDGEGGFGGTFNSFAGVKTSLIVDIPGQPGAFALHEKHPSSDELLIL